MKFLHTADWHVGKTIQGRSRAAEHEEVLAEIAEVARSEQVDLTVVAGDLFDSASPAPDAERIVFEALLDLSVAAPVVVIPGNHDNERRLAALAPLFDLARVKVVPSIWAECLELDVRSGETARLALVPWLSQRYIVKAAQLMAHDADELSGQYEERMRSIVAALAGRFTDDAVNVFVAHMTITGFTLGGGERVAQTIFDYCVSSTVFPASCHYVALGHIHKPQSIPGPCPIHYCGSPLQLDFSDTEDERCVMLVDAAPRTPAVVETVALKAGRKLRTIRGTVAQLRALLDETGDAHLRVVVQERARVGLGDEIRELFPNAVKVVVEQLGDEGTRTHPARAGSSPRDLFTEYLKEKEIEDPALVALFDDVYEEAHATPAA